MRQSVSTSFRRLMASDAKGIVIGGALLGALASALLGGRFTWVSFGSPGETGRYMTGGALMGFGGVLAGGCTVGAGLAGVPTLSFAAILALASIAAGGVLANLAWRSGPAKAPGLQPAE